MSGVEQAVEIIKHSVNQDSSTKVSKFSKYHEKQDQGDKENEEEFEENEHDEDSDRQSSRYSSICSFVEKVFNWIHKKSTKKTNQNDFNAFLK